MNAIKQKDLVDWFNFEDVFRSEIEKLNIPIEKLWQFDKFDFKVKDKTYVEVKLRNCSRDKYATTKIIMKKYLEALNRSIKWETCYLVIKWEDSIWYINLLETPPVQTSYEMWRKDRGYVEMSWYAYFDISKFKEYTPNIFINN